ncbi:hypothetical protein [Actinomadura sp. DC4]|uniref:hypothetical protein n=1 Tax=Actinomadura sp. DC4 TaxID=3055069 RepID=UPI0025AFF9C8|nr:hypothetical protein [Actinomadura sp. DC4]MDN3351244.1 hypothetical protein [Actinomadura sp. DC4]
MTQIDAVPAPSTQRPRRRRVVSVTAAAAVACAAGIAYFVHAGRSITVRGTVTITENVVGGRTCLGAQGDEDLIEGAAVVVRAPSDEIVASGWLEEGVGGDLIDGNAQTCRFAFAVAGVPREDFYRVVVGRRAPVVFTYEQVAGRTVTVPTR